MASDVDKQLLDPPSKLPALLLWGLIAVAAAVLFDCKGWLDSYGLTANVVASILSIPLVVALTMAFIDRRDSQLRQKQVARGLFETRSHASQLVERYRTSVFNAFGVEPGELHARSEALERLSLSGEGVKVDLGDLMRLVADANLIADLERDFARRVAEYWELPEVGKLIRIRLAEVSRLLLTCERLWARSAGEGTTLEMSPKATSASLQLLAESIACLVQGIDEMTTHAAWTGNRAGYDWVGALFAKSARE